MAPAMSMRCITVPPRMNPSGFASFGRTTCTISVAEAEGDSGVGDDTLDLLQLQHRVLEVDAHAVLAQELVADDAANLEAK